MDCRVQLVPPSRVSQIELGAACGYFGPVVSGMAPA